MARFYQTIFALLVACCVLALTNSSYIDYQTAMTPSATIFDEYQLMEPIIIPESEDGSPWWYTPSRKSNMFKSHRYKSAIRQLHRQQQEKHLGGKKQGEDMRLPGNIIPISYNIRMFPFIELIESGNYTTDGYVEILIQCLKATSNISINSAELDIKNLTISACFSAIVVKLFLIFKITNFLFALGGKCGYQQFCRSSEFC